MQLHYLYVEINKKIYHVFYCLGKFEDSYTLLFTNDDMYKEPNGEFLNGAKTVVLTRDEKHNIKKLIYKSNDIYFQINRNCVNCKKQR